MKKLLVSILLLLSFSSVKAEMLDVDYNFIDTAFDGIKPVTNKEFDDTINRLTPQPIDNTFGGKLKAFLFGRKYGVTPAPMQQEQVDFGGEKKAIENTLNAFKTFKEDVQEKTGLTEDTINKKLRIAEVFENKITILWK